VSNQYSSRCICSRSRKVFARLSRKLTKSTTCWTGATSFFNSPCLEAIYWLSAKKGLLSPRQEKLSAGYGIACITWWTNNDVVTLSCIENYFQIPNSYKVRSCDTSNSIFRLAPTVPPNEVTSLEPSLSSHRTLQSITGIPRCFARYRTSTSWDHPFRWRSE